MSDTALAAVPAGAGLYPTLNMEDAFKFAKSAAASGVFKVQSADAALVTIMAGREIGLSPVVTLMNVHLIKGKLTMAADLMAALARRQGIEIRLVKTSPDAATYAFKGQGIEEWVDFEFTFAEAQQAQLVKPDSGWEKYPAAMCRARALSQGLRACYPGLMSGAYLPEELAEAEPWDGGDVITDEPRGTAPEPLPPEPTAKVDSPSPQSEPQESPADPSEQSQSPGALAARAAMEAASNIPATDETAAKLIGNSIELRIEGEVPIETVVKPMVKKHLGQSRISGSRLTDILKLGEEMGLFGVDFDAMVVLQPRGLADDE